MGPLSGLTRDILFSSFVIDSYLGKDGDDLGKQFLLLVDANIGDDLKSTLSSSPKFISTEQVDEGLMYTYSITEEEYQTVVKPFLAGKYSEISTTYRDTHFPDNVLLPTYNTRMVLMKHPNVIKYWSDKGVELPDGAEVWSRPDISNETYTQNVWIF